MKKESVFKGERFTIENRKKLGFLLREGFTVAKIARQLDISSPRIYLELKRGLTDEEYKDGRFLKYSMVRALEYDAKTKIGEDGMEILKKHYRGKK